MGDAVVIHPSSLTVRLKIHMESMRRKDNFCAEWVRRNCIVLDKLDERKLDGFE